MDACIAHFRFAPARGRFTLASVHPGHSVGEVLECTGFQFECPDDVHETPAPSSGQLGLIRGRVAAEVAQTYPEFAASKLGYRAA